MNRFKKVLLLVIGVNLFPRILFAGTEINLSRINVYADQEGLVLTGEESGFNELFLKELQSTDNLEALEFRMPEGASVKTILEASRYTSDAGIPLLVYGYIRVTDRYLDAELKVYSAETGEIVKYFYSKADRQDFDLLLRDLSMKVVAWFYDTRNLVLTDDIPAKPHFGMIQATLGAGFWSAVGIWDNTMDGQISAELGAKFVPAERFDNFRRYRFFYRAGAVFNYGYASNSPDNLPLNNHILKVRVPFDICVELARKQNAYFSVAPFYEANIYSQRQPDNSVEEGIDHSFGLGGGPGYEIYLGRDRLFMVGVKAQLDVTFVDPLKLTITPMIYASFNIRLKPPEKE